MGGSGAEAEHYRELFPDRDVIGFDYTSQTPWEAEAEFPAFVDSVSGGERVVLIANSIGAYFSINSLDARRVDRAFLISPVVDMEALIAGMMAAAHVAEDELRSRGEIHTHGGETLSLEYLCYARTHPTRWAVPSEVLYGEFDSLTTRGAIESFAAKTMSRLTVMPGGEHWFHTAEQMAFLDAWIRRTI